MREGVNPEKFNRIKNKFYLHRIIIPVYIPNIKEEFYKGSAEVFKQCLDSLCRTINYETTAITIVNNGVISDLLKLLDVYIEKGLLDKVVKYGENKGKVYAAVSEAKASYEPFITIADADVLFFSGWEEAVFKIYKNFPKAGVVSPVPSQNLSLYKNSSVFFDNFLLGKIKYEKKVSDEDCNLFLQGLGNEALHWRHNRTHSWKQKQYFLDREVPAILGANHFVATYRKEVFLRQEEFPLLKFKKGYEEKFLDEPADKIGWYRLSTVSTFAYHVGNKKDDVMENVIFDPDNKLDTELISGIEIPQKAKIPYRIRTSFFRILRKVKQL